MADLSARIAITTSTWQILGNWERTSQKPEALFLPLRPRHPMIKALQRPAIKAVLLALGVLLPTLQAKAETRFVDPANEAQDSLADGSLAHPFASLTAA
jgi:hypothetical protein